MRADRHIAGRSLGVLRGFKATISSWPDASGFCSRDGGGACQCAAKVLPALLVFSRYFLL